MSRAFHPGQEAKSSGIYQVVHGQDHYHDHEVTIMSGSIFPACLTCGDEVRFMRLRLARAVEKHSEFDPSKEHSDDGETSDLEENSDSHRPSSRSHRSERHDSESRSHKRIIPL